MTLRWLPRRRPTDATAPDHVAAPPRGDRAPAEHVVVVPVYNEREGVVPVLEGLEALGYGSIIAVDDGSTDGSSALLDEWAASRPAVEVLHLVPNQGKSAALQAAWDHLARRLEAGTVTNDTVVITVDADGQHDLGQLEALLARMRTLGADAVIARRDLSYHRTFKRTGNQVMALLGSVFAGQRLHDIESGYRLVRLEALLHAREFYSGHRYSESVELMVVLARLGYRVDNDFVVPVPIARTRTTLLDAARHGLAMFLAYYRVVCWRSVPTGMRSRLAAVFAAGMILVFAGFLAIILSHRIYLGDDSASSYARVWFIATHLYSGSGVPLHIGSLEAGRAFTFPYGFLPWVPTAIVRPVLGDWAVTASLILGVVLLIAGIWRWLPRTAAPWMTALILLNWQFWNGILQFQLTSLWALAFACFAAAAFDRKQWRRGVALAVAAVVAHPLMGVAALGITLLVAIEAERRLPWQRIALLALACLIAAPAIWMFVRTPSMSAVASWSPALSARLLAQRLSIIVWPWVLSRFWTVTLRAHAPLLLAGTLLLFRNVEHSNPRNLRWQSLERFPDFQATQPIDPQARYRVLTMSNQEDGMFQLMQSGAHLAQDFFDESIYRHSFSSPEAYRCFLARKRANRVLVNAQWMRRGYTNEVRLLDQMVSDGRATLLYQGSAGTREYGISAEVPATCPTTN